MGEDLVLRHVVKVRSSIPVRWLGVRYPGRRRETGEPIALHANEADREKHEQMGFHEGWGTALDQLVEVAQGL